MYVDSQIHIQNNLTNQVKWLSSTTAIIPLHGLFQLCSYSISTMFFQLCSCSIIPLHIQIISTTCMALPYHFQSPVYVICISMLMQSIYIHLTLQHAGFLLHKVPIYHTVLCEHHVTQPQACMQTCTLTLPMCMHTYIYCYQLHKYVAIYYFLCVNSE